MKSLAELIAEKEALDQKIDEIRRSTKTEIIQQIKQIMNDHGLTAEDIYRQGPGRPSKFASEQNKKVAAKYRDPVTGKEWSGRGMAPVWIRDKSREDYLI